MQVYQKNWQPCPKCGQPKDTRSLYCANCDPRHRGVTTRIFVERLCEGCGNSFAIPLWRIKQGEGRGRFCSRACKDAHQSLLIGKLSPRWRGGTKARRRGIAWKVARQWALLRADNKCDDCGITGVRLDVHHIIPGKQFTNEVSANSPSNLRVLCRSCHMKRENFGKKEVMQNGEQ